MDADLRSVDTLRFQGMATYKDRLKKYQDSSGLTDAVLSGHGMIEGCCDCRHGFQLSRRHHGLGRRRTDYPDDRIWNR